MSDILQRLDRLESANQIRRVMARYMALCDALNEDTPMDELGELFATDAVWAGRGARYGVSFGAHIGRDAIVAMLDKYRGPTPHFSMNAHFLTSEDIRTEAEAAQGTWVMLQTSTYASGTSDLRAARLKVAFAREGGLWRINRFETENLFSRVVDHWSDDTVINVPVTAKA